MDSKIKRWCDAEKKKKKKLGKQSQTGHLKKSEVYGRTLCSN